MKRLIALLLALCVSNAYAQSPVTTQPYGATSFNASSSIAVTNTFQSIWAASTTTTGRVGCTIQNLGSNKQFVFFGPIANAITKSSVTLNPLDSVQCAAGVASLRDQVSITGTSGDAFFAAQQ